MKRIMYLLVAGMVSISAKADEAVVQPATDHGPFVAGYLVKRLPGMSFEEFKAYQIETHVPLALALPGLLDYRLTFFEPQDGTAQPFDALAEVTFESAEAHAAALASPEGEAARADLVNMVDLEAIRVVTSGADSAFAGLLPAQ
ncbi:MAG: EthD family reductase [Pseudomonadota bacterium]